MANSALFLDTAYIYALFNTRDQWHAKAVEWEGKIAAENLSLLTTQFVLAEVADGLSAPKFRRNAAKIIHALQESDFVKIIDASSDLFHRALILYEQRQDKSWGLTDCASFVVMNENNISEALTADEHFRQAGFKALLLD
ncbi:MAG: PIN domain-containing protein [Pyrinomonadaceae bacterium]|nr:PIN domain-containing protein [Pyrinomonadaceae bacterium]